MITTVTTTTTPTVATGSLALIAILTLIGLLILKEIISGLSSTRAGRLSRALNIAIAPLLVTCLVTMALKIADVLH